MRKLIIAAYVAVTGFLVGVPATESTSSFGGVTIAEAGPKCITEECRIHLESQISYWKQRALGSETVVVKKKRVVQKQVVVKQRVVRKKTTTVATGGSVNTCVTVTQYDPAFLSAFAYKNGKIIWSTSWDAGTRTKVCLPRGIWEKADRFWVCKGANEKLPNGRGKRLEASDMNDWRRVGKPLGVMNIKG